MRGRPTSFWGKLQADEDGEVVAWHPLADHCADVASVTEALLALRLWRRRIATLIGRRDLSVGLTARLAALSALHDIGKFSLCFQVKGRPDLRVPPGGHVDEAVAAIRSNLQVSTCLETLGVFGDGGMGLLLSAVCHHGRPRVGAADQQSRWRALAGLDPIAGIRELVQRLPKWFPEAFAPGAEELPTHTALEHAFAGLVMLADWVGSTPEFFPYSECTDDRMPYARRRAKEVVEKLALSWPEGSRLDTRARGPFARVSPHEPTAAQRELSLLPRESNGSIAILESETGSGKTEAALAHFIGLLEAGLVDGLYFALPTRTAATQIFDRVRAATERAFTNPPAVVLAVPGYLRVDDAEGVRLPGFEVLWPDTDRFRFRAWAAETPKRYLAGSIVVGTIDQILLSSLLVNHAHLRATSLLRHLLVIDEVHASDAYMTRLLHDVLGRHGRAGGHALLLSATLTAEARERFLGGTTPPIEVARSEPYPLVSCRSATCELRRPIAFDGREKQVRLDTVPMMADHAQLARVALDAAASGAKVLVLRNTVSDCIATQLEVEAIALGREALLFRCAGMAAPHHGRFAREDRVELDHALEARIGKHQSTGGVVVVATQTVQQSLDIDVDLMWTDLCPVDVLLQRIGRLHRHVRPRPKGYETPLAHILVPAERDLSVLVGESGRARNYHGLGSVYEDLRVIDATWACLEATADWRIPSMARSLVESCLHPNALDAAVARYRGRLDRHREVCLGQGYGHRRIAELNLVDWLKPYSEMEFPTSVDQRIQTRLGEGDRLVNLGVDGVLSPFAKRVHQLSLRAWWCAGIEEVSDAENMSSHEGVVRFGLGHKTFIYDRLGLRLEKEADVGDGS